MSRASQLLRAADAYLEFAHTRPREFELVFSRPRPPDQVGLPAHSPLLPIVVAIRRAVEQKTLTPSEGLTPLDMALSLWTQVHGIATLRTRYLAETHGFDEKARRIVTATVGAWSHRPR